MSTDGIVVSARGLGKCFTLYPSPRARLAHWLRMPGRPQVEEFWALRDASFDVRRGEAVGIVGINGAGKSTLLKLLSGVIYPTVGQIDVFGSVLSLLELGAGFVPELTGRQNVEQSARWLGVSRTFINEKSAEIEAFAELGEYYDRPVGLYSTGMFVRLGFSLFSAMDPEIFVVDEVLAVGDMRFAAKAINRITRMLESGTTLLFVSHDLQLVNHLCSRALWLHAGALQMDAAASDVTRAYQQFVIHREPATDNEIASQNPDTRRAVRPRLTVTDELEAMHTAVTTARPIADAPARITSVITRDGEGNLAVEFDSLSALAAEITIEALADVDCLVAGIQVRDAADRMIWTTRLDWQHASLPALKSGDTVTVGFRTPRLLLDTGNYQLTVACHRYPHDEKVFHWIDGAWKFSVRGHSDGRQVGPLVLDWDLQPVRSAESATTI